VKAYKLMRKRKDGSFGSLFIDRRTRYEAGPLYVALAYRTKGYAYRPGFHCTPTTTAPHLHKRGRVWVEVDIHKVEKALRPAHQGGMWYLAQRMQIIGEVDD